MKSKTRSYLLKGDEAFFEALSAVVKAAQCTRAEFIRTAVEEQVSRYQRFVIPFLEHTRTNGILVIKAGNKSASVDPMLDD